MQAPARVCPFFSTVTHPNLSGRRVLWRGLDLFPVVIKREFGSGALERLDRSELSIERLFFLPISCLDFGSTKLDRLFGVLDIV